MIGIVDNAKLGFKSPGKHYVYIRGVNRQSNTASVNTFTSLSDFDGNYNFKRIRQG